MALGVAQVDRNGGRGSSGASSTDHDVELVAGGA